jgi:S1-C subfamily serine protease
MARRQQDWAVERVHGIRHAAGETAMTFLRTHFLIVALALNCCLVNQRCLAQESLAEVAASVQPKIVKVHGAGSAKLESYHTGILISAEGHILTAWSYVLEAQNATVTLADGRRHKAELLGIDPELEIAILKISAETPTFFDWKAESRLTTGEPIMAFSNLYGVAAGDEQVSVQQGLMAGKLEMTARRGSFPTPFRGEVYLLDAITNNPGAAGGALTNRAGQLTGVLGKELRNSLDNTWLNYALPLPALQKSIGDILAGKSPTTTREETAKRPSEHYTLADLGLELVPDVLVKTPPYIERVIPQSSAAKAELRADDLILFVNGKVVASCKSVVEELAFTDRLDAVRLTVQRGQELVEVTLRAQPQ